MKLLKNDISILEFIYRVHVLKFFIIDNYD